MSQWLPWLVLLMKKKPAHILTIEDPVEYVYKTKKSIIDGGEVGIDTADFGDAVVKALLVGSMVISIGEMRNLETIGTAV